MKSKKLKLKKEVVCILKEMNLHIGQGGADTFHSNCLCTSENAGCRNTEKGCEQPYTTDPVLSRNNCGETGRCVVVETKRCAVVETGVCAILRVSLLCFI